MTQSVSEAMLPFGKQVLEGVRKPVRVRRGPATVTGERAL